MAKWYGKIGYEIVEETSLGVWTPMIIEKEYPGDMTSNRWRRQNSGEINDNINLSNVISILADQFALQNYSNMAYVEIAGTKWKITDIEIQIPRLLLTIGGVYNG